MSNACYHLDIGRAIKPAADNKETKMNSNLFPSKVLKRGYFLEADIPNIQYASEVLERHRKANSPAPDYSKGIAHNRRVQAERSFTNASAPIFERDFPKFGVKPIERAFFKRHPNSAGNRVGPFNSSELNALVAEYADNKARGNGYVAAPSDAQILALSNGEPVSISRKAPPRHSKVFPLGGVPKASLRVQYHVRPVIEWSPDGSKIESVYGNVLPGEVEYIIESAPGAVQAIAEWSSVSALPLALRRIEESGRPNHEDLGWSESDLLEVSGEHPDNDEP